VSDAARGAGGEVVRLGRDAGVADLEPGTRAKCVP
jgi:hypothetical protein